MSRAAAVPSSSCTPTSGAVLVLRDNPNGGSSTALLRSEPCGSNDHPVEVGALQTVRSAATNLNVNFFSKNYEAGFEFACLLDSALNADLKTVTEITTAMHPNKLRRLLSAEHGTGFATTRLGRVVVERTGTPLQMAIYDHDEEMVEYFKEKMDPAEFQRQCEAVVGTDYDAFLRKQNTDATALCAGLEAVFTAALPNEFTVDHGYVACTTSSQYLSTIDAFINKLTDYVTNNPVYNPYILQRAYKIYNRLPSDRKRDYFFLQKVIGGVQSFLSARWLQHYAQGIDYLVANNEAPRRLFICRNSNPYIDIRPLVSSCIGSDSFLSILGRPSPFALGTAAPLFIIVDNGCKKGWQFYKTYAEQKQQAFRTYYAAGADDSLRNCVK